MSLRAGLGAFEEEKITPPRRRDANPGLPSPCGSLRCSWVSAFGSVRLVSKMEPFVVRIV